MQIAQFSLMATSQRVDSANGVIYGVSVITEGQAAGHDLWIDSASVEKIKELSKGGTKVKINHPQKGENPPFETTAGSLENFRIEGKQLRADLHLLKSDAYFDKIIEMASKMPDKFGLSVRIEQDIEKKDGKEFCRPTAITSVDLVDEPAANPTGLFSKGDKDEVKMSADGKTHTKECMCKTCMAYSKKTKSMSAIFAKALSLPETATETEIALELTKQLAANKPADLTELQKKIDSASTTLAELQAKNKEGIELAKKNEVAALVAEAGRDGKTIPLSDVQLAKMDVVDIKDMITRLPKGTVSLQKKKPAVPVNDKGEPVQLDRSTPEGRQAVIAFCRERREAGAAQLGQFIRQQTESAIN